MPGFRIDRVKTITKAAIPILDGITPWQGPTGQAAKHEQYHNECLNLFKEVYPAVVTDPQALSRSLVAGQLVHYVPLPAIDFFAVHLRLLEVWTAMASGGTMRSVTARELVVIDQWKLALAMQEPRRFFVTEAGRVGLGPERVEKGDHVCVFYSARPLYLLRYVDADAPAELVGDAYVDGLMALENMPGDTRGEDEVFAIC